MTRVEVERLLGEPFYGYTRFGDPTEDSRLARYRQPVLWVTYERGVVIHVDPPYRQLILAGGGE